MACGRKAASSKRQNRNVSFANRWTPSRCFPRLLTGGRAYRFSYTHHLLAVLLVRFVLYILLYTQSCCTVSRFGFLLFEFEEKTVSRKKTLRQTPVVYTLITDRVFYTFLGVFDARRNINPRTNVQSNIYANCLTDVPG